jgi:fumarate reductase subunit D
VTRSNEPFWWSLFAAGGMVAAMLVPAHLLVLGILGPLGVVEPLSWEEAHRLFSHPLARVYLVVLVALPLFHWAHRFRFTLADLGLRRVGLLLAVLFYGAAIAGTGLAVAAVLAL